MKQCYILSNNRTFFFRFTNSAFGSKWCGLWFPSTKVLEYLAFNINGEWLGENNFKGFSLENGTAEHIYKPGNLVVKERITVPLELHGLIDVLQIENRGRREKFTLQLKPGINIRDVGENSHTRKYNIIETKPLYITSDISDIAIFSKTRTKFLIDEKYIGHTPGRYISDWGWRDEVEQSVYEPGLIETTFEIGKGESRNIPFLISNRQDLDDMMDYKKLVEQRSELGTNRSGFYSDKQVSKMAQTMFSFANDSLFGSGFFAGFPWFQSYWARDSAHIIFSLTNLGMWEEVKKSLFTLARYEKDGNIPNTLYLSGVPNYHAADSGPLFVIALHHYLKYSKDGDSLKKLSPVVDRIIERGVNLINDDLIYSHSGATWMDTLGREGHCIEIQSIWAEAFLRASEILNKKYVHHANGIVKKMNKIFWRGGFFMDRIGDYSRRANVLFPLFFGQIDKEKAVSALKVLESEKFTSSRGIRSMSSGDPIYNPRAYHDGNVWGLLTGMMCYSEFMYHRIKQGFRYLNMIKRNLGIRCVNSVDEVYTGDSNFPMGCVSQAWSISPVIKTVDEMILGFDPDLSDSIYFEPRIPADMDFERRGLRIGRDMVDVSFSDGIFTIKGIKENNLKLRTKYKVNVI